MYRSASLSAAAVLAASWLAVGVQAQSYQDHNLTPDGYWHNRYHMLLSMAAYGDYNTTCPLTFTEASLLNNFPNATRPPWTVISTFGPTPSGCAGYTAIVPEMNKALIVFKGDYELELSIPTDTVTWDEVGLAAPQNCSGCTVNQFAVQGYLECKEATNDFQAIREVYYGQGLVFSITGHGLGGMHSQIAAVDFYSQDVDYYNHAYGSPRVFNKAGAVFYNERFNGEAGERGTYNNDQMGEIIPEGVNYTHAGTPFYYHGWNESAQQPAWTVCWLSNKTWYTLNTTEDTSTCEPQVWPATAGTTAIEDHYFYMGNVGECSQSQTANTTLIDAFVANATASGDTPTLSNLTSLESLGQSMATSQVESLSRQSVSATASPSTTTTTSAPAPSKPANNDDTSGATWTRKSGGTGLLLAGAAAVAANMLG